MNTELQKLAALAIEELSDENKNLRLELETRKEAEAIVREMVKTGQLAPELIFLKLDEFYTKGPQDLEIIKVAMTLGVQNTVPQLFQLSNSNLDVSTMDNITRMLIEDAM